MFTYLLLWSACVHRYAGPWLENRLETFSRTWSSLSNGFQGSKPSWQACAASTFSLTSTLLALHSFLSDVCECFAWCVCVCALPVIMVGTESSGTGSCELSCGCWKHDLGPLEEQRALLTTEPSFQTPPLLVLRKKVYNWRKNNH